MRIRWHWSHKFTIPALILSVAALIFVLTTSTASAQTAEPGHWIYVNSHIDRTSYNSGICNTGLTDGFRPFIYFEEHGTVDQTPLVLDEESKHKLQAYVDGGGSAYCRFNTLLGGTLTVNDTVVQMTYDVPVDVTIWAYSRVPQMRLEPVKPTAPPIPPRRREI